MQTEREIRAEIIAQLTNVYANSPGYAGLMDTEPAKAAEALADVSDPGWTDEEVAAAYVQAVSLFLLFGKEVEVQGGPSFLEYLQRQALSDVLDNEPPEDS